MQGLNACDMIYNKGLSFMADSVTILPSPTRSIWFMSSQSERVGSRDNHLFGLQVAGGTGGTQDVDAFLHAPLK